MCDNMSLILNYLSEYVSTKYLQMYYIVHFSSGLYVASLFLSDCYSVRNSIGYENSWVKQMLFCRCVLDRYLLDRWASDSYMSDRKVLKVRDGLTLTKLAGNQPSSSSICPHHQSLFEASNTLMTSPALKASSRSAMVTWSHTASAFTTEPPLTNYRKIEGEVQDKLQEDNSYIT